MSIAFESIADDHHVVRGGLRALLETEDDILVVGEASDGVEAVLKTRGLNPGRASARFGDAAVERHRGDSGHQARKPGGADPCPHQLLG